MNLLRAELFRKKSKQTFLLFALYFFCELQINYTEARTCPPQTVNIIPHDWVVHQKIIQVSDHSLYVGSNFWYHR